MTIELRPTRVRVVLVTLPSMEVGRSLVGTLVDEGLVACGNLVPGLVSIFPWEGQVQEEAEVLAILKTVEERLPDLVRRVPELHPYDVPEVLSLPVDRGHDPYLNWVADVASSPSPQDETDDGQTPGA